MEFVGWSVGDRKYSNKNLTTMANIGIGSTKAELEAAYNVEIRTTPLGQEFSTIPGDIYETSDTRQISFMWSGLSCNFR